jgi:hypothetical protein
MLRIIYAAHHLCCAAFMLRIIYAAHHLCCASFMLRIIYAAHIMESKRTRDLCKLLRQRRGVLSYPLIGSTWAPKGWPDRLMLHELFGTVLVEFKEGDAELRADQRTVAHDIIKAGGRFVVCRFYNSDALRLELGNNIGLPFGYLQMPEAIAHAIGEWYKG